MLSDYISLLTSGFSSITSNPEHLKFFHIFISIAAFGILGLAMLQAGLLSLQNYLLRNKSGHGMGMIRFLPPIETMETRLFQIVLWGFILLSVSLLSTCIFTDNMYISSRFHKILLSGLAWSLFAVLLLGRKYAGWRGPTAVRWTLISTSLLIVAYFSSKLILLND